MTLRQFLSAQPINLPIMAALLLMVFWCALLLIGRIAVTGTLQYVFLLWNLALAMMPLVLSSMLFLKLRAATRCILATLWILFLPNAPYIVTDFKHLHAIQAAPIWFDILMIFSYAGAGLAFGYASVLQVHELLSKKNRVLGWAVVLASFFLSGFGIYLGRFLRWNSMDLFQAPFLLIFDVADRIFSPSLHPRTWGVTFGFGTVLLLGYIMLIGIRQSGGRKPIENEQADTVKLL